MAKNSSIEWTKHTANLWHGCTKVHEGCDNCYAAALSKRWGNDVWGNDKPRKQIRSVWDDLLKYQKEADSKGEMHRVFVGSMMDIFEKPLMLLPILTTTQPGDLVVDPFGGSGSTLITAILMGRKGVMYEKQKRFAELAEQRLNLISKEVNLEEAKKIEGLGKGTTTIDITHLAEDTSKTAKKRTAKKKAA